MYSIVIHISVSKSNHGDTGAGVFQILETPQDAFGQVHPGLISRPAALPRILYPLAEPSLNRRC